MIGLKRGTVRLCEYEPEWGRRAKATVEVLKSILDSAASDIQHVGSTAVPAIRSNPIIDIAVAVADYAPVLDKLPQLETAGFWLSMDNRPRELLLVSGSREEDTRDYGEPDTILLSLGHRDVFLNFFRGKREQMLELRSGMKLFPAGNGLADGNGTVLLLYSMAFRERLKRLAGSGYTVQEAVIRCIVAWKAEDDPEETAILLPDVYLGKRSNPQ